ncbi:MAG: AraC family transcriptional regulator [Flavobacteriales bacterium]|nr:helix-turn-helix transcriptional regulator [Flavobacteriales bacterium]MCL4280879.1 AraC family transcriptional regulator [Flavobacteriales bacterium]
MRLALMEPYPKAYLYKRIVQAKLFMDDHFTEHIDLAAICWEASFSKFHFTRLFREVYGTTPKAYLSKLRIEQAAQLLDQGMPVADACLNVGFESIPTFSNAFRKQVGKTPAAYRKAREERLQSMKEEPMDHIPNCYAVWLGWQIEDRNPE